MEIEGPRRWLTWPNGADYGPCDFDALWREKLCVFNQCPYRKPTQVDEERILRPSGEGLLRNSAK